MFINVSFVTDKKIKALNKKYLGRDYATDVLSFNYSEGDYLGDIAVSTQKAREQALSYGNTYEQELADLVAHGVLHLLGIHHKGDDEKKERRKHETRSRTRKSGSKIQK